MERAGVGVVASGEGPFRPRARRRVRALLLLLRTDAILAGNLRVLVLAALLRLRFGEVLRGEPLAAALEAVEVARPVRSAVGAAACGRRRHLFFTLVW